MHSLTILASKGCTQDRLRTIFTSTGPATDEGATQSTGADTGGAKGSSPEEALTTAGTRNVPYQGIDQATSEPRLADAKKPADWEIRRRFEYRVRSRIINGIATGINNSRPLQAVDIAWDAPPIQKETIPLLLWAQGKIKHEGVCDFITKNCDPTTARKFVRKTEAGGMMVNVPRICDISINLVRSYVTRRHAALAALWDNLWPLLKYDPRGTDQTAMLRADALTQRVDIMAEDYNYRHFLSQCDRDKLLYCTSMIFPRGAWDRKFSLRYKPSNVEGAQGKSEQIESYITAEGVDCVNPHPSRWFWDLGAPLANINTDNGPSYVGYWDIVPYGTIRKGTYYNIDRVVASEAWLQLVQMQSWYFAQYFDPCVLAWPNLGPCADPALMNDRTGNIGLYTAEMADKGVLLTQYYEKINPLLEGIGDYDCDVWIRLSAAGDGTIVAAEFLPSIPACYGAINANDNRVANASLASEMLPFQDMASNIVTTMLEQVRRSFTQLWVFNKDLLSKEIIDDLEKNAKNQEWWIDPKVLVISMSEKAEMLQAGGGLNLNAVVAQINVQLNNAVENALRALAQLLALADRLVNSSPNELGQPNPREVSARETQEISTTIQSVYSFYNEGPREQRAAFKKMIYESLICCGTDEFTVPVLRRYQKQTIEDAGFRIIDPGTDLPKDALMPEMTRIMGNVQGLNFSYYFDSRDGAERSLNTQGAQVLQQFVVGLLQIPGVAQKLGLKRLFTMLNIVARMAGAPDEFQLVLDDGEDTNVPPEGGEAGAIPPQVQQVVQALMQQMQGLAVKDSQIEQALGVIFQRLGIQPPASAPAAAQGPSGPVAPPNSVPPASPSPATPPPGAPAPNGAKVLAEPVQ